MKTIATLFGALLASGSAFAADRSDLAYQGTGSRAGGYAYMLNDGSRAPAALLEVPHSPADLAYSGTGSRAGGYANSLNGGGAGPFARTAPPARSRVPLAYQGRGSYAGGYANFNR